MMLIRWKKKEAELEWYADFQEEMKSAYERLGHKIDGLQAFNIDVQSYHCDFKSYIKKERRVEECLY